ncbi:MAG TPA: hypothetical protein VFB76_13180 [Candidatus Angelobacter sp.]|nr:hypothetical protein [Candidatus Angelobacter sp.]
MAEYRTGLLTYVDILGFRDLIDESVRDSNAIEHIANILFQFEQQFTTGGRVGVDANNMPVPLSHFHNFSDLMLRITLMDGNADLIQYLNWELLTLAHRQLMVLLNDGTLIRGAVTLDKVYCQGKFVFGPAVVNGYLMEQGLAIHPRIILDDKLMEQAAKSKSDSQLEWQYFTHGDDGIPFVDYLCGVYWDISTAKVQSTISPYDLVAQHRDFVLTKLNVMENKDMKRKAKVWWMWQYHNAAISRLQIALKGNQDAIDALEKRRLISR